MGSYARFEHYLTTLEVETCPEFWSPSPLSGPLCESPAPRPAPYDLAPPPSRRPSRDARHPLHGGPWRIYVRRATLLGDMYRLLRLTGHTAAPPPPHRSANHYTILRGVGGLGMPYPALAGSPQTCATCQRVPHQVHAHSLRSSAPPRSPSPSPALTITPTPTLDPPSPPSLTVCLCERFLRC